MRLIDWFFFFWIAPFIAFFVLYFKLLIWLLVSFLKLLILACKAILAGLKLAIAKTKEMLKR